MSRCSRTNRLKQLNLIRSKFLYFYCKMINLLILTKISFKVLISIIPSNNLNFISKTNSLVISSINLRAIQILGLLNKTHKTTRNFTLLPLFSSKPTRIISHYKIYSKRSIKTHTRNRLNNSLFAKNLGPFIKLNF